MSPDLIERLRAGLEGVTPGEWRPGHLVNDDHSCDCGFVFDSLDRQGSIATVNMDDGGQFGKEYPSREEAKANLKYIIAAQPRNIRTILDALAAKDTALSEMRAELDEANADRCFASDDDPACKLEHKFIQMIEAERKRRLAAESELERFKKEAAARFKRDGENLTEADRRAEALRKALEPFAKEATEYTGGSRLDWEFAPDNELISTQFCDLTYGDFRAAARALAPSIQDEGEAR